VDDCGAGDGGGGGGIPMPNFHFRLNFRPIGRDQEPIQEIASLNFGHDFFSGIERINYHAPAIGELLVFEFCPQVDLAIRQGPFLLGNGRRAQPAAQTDESYRQNGDNRRPF